MSKDWCIENDFAAQKELAAMEGHNTMLIWEENKALRARVSRLEEAGRNILCKIPETKNDYSGVGYCFGCGVVKWASGQGSYSEECKPDCALQEFRRALEEK